MGKFTVEVNETTVPSGFRNVSYNGFNARSKDNSITLAPGANLNDIDFGYHDLDECQLNTHNCDPNANCINTFGSFICKCNYGYLAGHGTSCDLIMGSFAGKIWADRNTNGEMNSGESPLSGVSVIVTNEDGRLISNTTTDAEGQYKIEDVLPMGNYTVTVTDNTIPAGWRKAGYDKDTGNDGKTRVPLTPGEIVADINFGWLDVNECNTKTHNCDSNANCTNTLGSFYCYCDKGFNGQGTACTELLGSIGDSVWVETSENGQLDADEKGLSGVVIILTQPDNTTQYATTDAMGNYHFTGLTFGEYLVKANVSTVPVGLRVSGYDRDGGKDSISSVNLPPGAKLTDIDFAFMDRNECTLKKDNCDQNANCTNTLGSFTCTCSYGHQGSGIDCSRERGAIEGVLWFDKNANDDLETTEQIFSGVTIVLVDSVGTVVARAVTNDTGIYSFTFVPTGNYKVQVETATVVSGITNPGYDKDGNNDAMILVTVVANRTVTDVDFGFLDVNECTEMLHNCAETGNCTNTLGSFLCKCNYGHEGEGTECTQRLGSIGDTVWVDVDNNSIPDIEEKGQSNVVVTLTDSNGTIKTTTTNAEGEYRFADLTFGTYTININLSTVPPGVQIAGYDMDGDEDGKTTITLDPGQIIKDVDFGLLDVNECTKDQHNCNDEAMCYNTVGSFTCTCNLGWQGEGVNCSQMLGSIGDYVWIDTNENGEEDTDEPPLANVSVKLTDSDGKTIDTIVTDSKGKYMFNGLPMGDYVVTVDNATVLLGFRRAVYDKDTIKDSTTNVVLAPGSTFVDIDFGYNDLDECQRNIHNCDTNANCTNTFGSFTCTCNYGYEPGSGTSCDPVMGTIAGQIWADVNTNNGMDPSEIPLSGDAGQDGKTSVALTPGKVVTDLDFGWLDVDECSAKTHNCDGNANCTNTLGSFACYCDKGYDGQGTNCSQLLGSIGDTVWIETTENGQLDSFEKGLSGVVIILTLLDNTTKHTTTDTHGKYLFTSLPFGEYLVNVNVSTVPVGLRVAGYDRDGNRDSSTYVDLPPGVKLSDVDFAFIDRDECILKMDNCDENANCSNSLSSFSCKCMNGYYGDGINCSQDTGGIRGGLWFDKNVNGDFDSNEQVLSGITIALVDHSGIVVAKTVTNHKGFYNFTAVPSGNYSVQVEITTVPSGVSLTGDDVDGDNDGATFLMVVANKTVTDVNFAFLDVNECIGQLHNCAQSAYCNNTLGSFLCSCNIGHKGKGTECTQLLGSIGDTVWVDVDNNSILDIDEKGLANVTVNLVNNNGIQQKTTTNKQGKYLFTNIVFGNYSISIDFNSVPVGVQQFGFDMDGNEDGTLSLSLNPGQILREADFGLLDINECSNMKHIHNCDNNAMCINTIGSFICKCNFGWQGEGVNCNAVLGSIGDTVWIDKNNNGKMDDDEKPLPNVNLLLINQDGNITKATTDAKGMYIFDKLTPGKYIVAVNETTVPYGFRRAVYNKNALLNNNTTVVLSPGVTINDIDFGYNDMDECQLNKHLCDVNSKCSNTFGSFICKCNYGYQSASGAACTALLGSIVGHIWANDSNSMVNSTIIPLTGVTIVITDENGHMVANATTDAQGKYKIEDVLHMGNHTVTVAYRTIPTGFRTPGYDKDYGEVVTDVNFEWLDVNECATKTHNCDKNANCTNSFGSFACACNDGYKAGHSTSCDVIMGTIAGKVWADSNTNDKMNSNEMPLSGVSVIVTNEDGRLIANATTDTQGKYKIEDVSPMGNYTVTVTDNTISAGWRKAGYDKDTGNDGKTHVPLKPGEVVTDIDFGWLDVNECNTKTHNCDSHANCTNTLGSFFCYCEKGYNGQGTDCTELLGSIGDTVWVETTENGQLDADEKGLSGVVLILTQPDNTTQYATTDAMGKYHFTGLTFGKYTLTANISSVPVGLRFSGYDRDGGKDSISFVNLPPGARLSDVDFAFMDIDECILENDNCHKNANCTNTLSSFVCNCVNGYQGNGIICNQKLGDIEGEVWFDKNSNGDLDDTEQGLSGISLALVDNIGKVVAKTITDYEGFYSFTGVPSGNYTVEVETTTILAGANRPGHDRDGNNDAMATVTVVANTTVADVDFGFLDVNECIENLHNCAETANCSNTIGSFICKCKYGHKGEGTKCTQLLGSIGDMVWVDADDNSILDIDEKGQANVVVTLTNSNGTMKKSTTDAEGMYMFTNLIADTYIININLNTVPLGVRIAGYDMDSNEDGKTTTTLNPGQILKDVDFGLLDVNECTKNRHGCDDQAMCTNIVGSFICKCLRRSGYDLDGSSDSQTAVNLQPGANKDDVDFAFLDTDECALKRDNCDVNAKCINLIGSFACTCHYGYVVNGVGATGTSCIQELGSINGTLWVDNNDGKIATSETKLSKVVVGLFSGQGKPISTTTTDKYGRYLFSNISTGNFSVVVNLKTVPSGFRLPSYDLDGNKDARTAITLLPGSMKNNVNFGFLDINECTTNEHNCNNNALCNDVAGSFNCQCNLGFTGDGVNCLHLVGNLTGIIWFDSNNNSHPDSNERFLPNISVVLINPHNKTNIIAKAITDKRGKYFFNNIPVGNYTVSVETNTVPIGINIPGFDKDGNRDATTSTIVIYNTVIRNLNFGFLDVNECTTKLHNCADTANCTNTLGSFTCQCRLGYHGIGSQCTQLLGSIGDTVWIDDNADGILDITEKLVPSVRVILVDEKSRQIKVNTNDKGYYLFANLTAGKYIVRLDSASFPVGFQRSGFDKDGRLDSRTAVLLEPGERMIDVDFALLDENECVGYSTPCDNNAECINTRGNYTCRCKVGFTGDGRKCTKSIGIVTGAVLLDINKDGKMNNDTGMAGIVVQLIRDGKIFANTTTDANGRFTFLDIPVDQYMLVYTMPGGHVLSYDPDDSLDGETFVKVDFNTSVDAIFGIMPSSCHITAVVFMGDKYNQSVTHVSGVNVSLINAKGKIVATSLTDSSGRGIFNNIDMATYTVIINLPNNTVAHYNEDRKLDDRTTLIMEPGEATTVYFGLGVDNNSVVYGHVLLDDEGNGPGNDVKGVPGVPIRLVDSTDVIISKTVSDSKGNYHFDNLFPGNYTVVIGVPSGYLKSYDGDSQTDGSVLVAIDNDNPSTVIFGIKPAVETITGKVLVDTNRDNKLTSDRGMPNVSVSLIDITKKVVSTVTTGPDGSYRFPNISEGNYTVKISLLRGYQHSYQPLGGENGVAHVVLKNGKPVDLVFGVNRIVQAVTGSVLKIIDKNIMSSQNVGLKEIVVKLLNDQGNVMNTTTTGLDGTYSFNQIVPNNYSVVINVPSELMVSYQPGNTTDGKAMISVIQGKDSQVIFGLKDITQDIVGRVLIDRNKDGTSETDPGMLGQTVMLSDRSGKVLATAKTDANGSFIFPSTPIGAYIVRVIVPNGAVVSYQTGHTRDGMIPVTVSSGASDSIVFGLKITTCNQNVRVFRQDSRNGYNLARKGMSGMMVELLNNEGKLIARNKTNSKGSINFRLPLGTFTIRIVVPNDMEVIYDRDRIRDGSYTFTVKAARCANVIFGVRTAMANINGLVVNDANGDGNLTGDSGYGAARCANVIFGVRTAMANINGLVVNDANGDGNLTGDSGYGGITVRLMKATNPLVELASQITAKTGRFVFRPVPVGSYVVQVAMPPLTAISLQQNSKKDGKLDVILKRNTTLNLLFGLKAKVGEAITGKILIDENLDNQPNDKLGAADMAVIVLTHSGVEVARTTTDDAGDFQFTGLQNGKYIVRVVMAPYARFSYGTNGVKGPDIPINLKSKPINLLLGLMPEISSVSGSVFLGKLPATAPPFPNISVALLNMADIAVNSAVTDATGKFSFTSVIVGNYTVKISIPDNYTVVYEQDRSMNGFMSIAVIKDKTAIVSFGLQAVYDSEIPAPIRIAQH
eukprot:Ihof_evm1s1092 gene=Ihof_evmTU1s1092